MKTKIIIALAGVLAALLIFDSARLLLARSDLYSVEASTSSGPTNATLDLIEFVDYTSTQARTIEPLLREAMKRDGKVRLVPRPVFEDHDPQSRSSALLVYAAERQGKFMAAHRALLQNFRAIDDGYISAFSKELGLDENQLRSDLEDPKLLKILMRNRAHMASFKSKTTPTFLIGRKLMLRVSEPLPDTAEFLTLFKQGRSY